MGAMQTEQFSSLQPRTVVAVRGPAGSGWRMLALECEPDELPVALEENGLQGQVYRPVGSGACPPELVDHFIARQALRRGWHRNRETGIWVPIDGKAEAKPSVLRAEKVWAAVGATL